MIGKDAYPALADQQKNYGGDEWPERGRLATQQRHGLEPLE